MISLLRAISILAVLSLCVINGHAQGLAMSAQTQVEPSTTVALADPVSLKITVTSNLPVRISSAALPELPDFAVQEERLIAAENADQKWQTALQIRALPLTAGELQFPSLSIPYTTEDGQSGKIQTPPAKLRVVNPLEGRGSPELLKDIQGPVRVSGIGGWIALAAAIVAAAALWIWRRRAKPQEAPEKAAEPARPLDEIILDELQALMDEYRRSGDVKALYIGLSNALRKFAAGRFGVETLEKTTSEIFAEMKRAQVDRKTANETKDLLSECDLVKFAKFVPSEKQIDQHWNAVREFVLKQREPAAEKRAP